MISSKYFNIIALVLTVLIVVLCIAGIGFSDKIQEISNAGYKMEYEEKLFGKDEIISVDVIMEADNWSEMLQNAMSEEYYKCDVIINGEKFQSVGIRPKGNTSLSSIASDPDNNRYSFKIEFDHFVGGQTCFGLDKLVLNNNFADSTAMKEALIYDMFSFLGADASLYNYAKISVNGGYFGVYLALEGVEDSFMLRNYGTAKGNLYKPEGMGRGGRGGMTSGGGANLNYSNDNLNSYSAIWEGDINGSNEADRKRVVAGLKAADSGENLESYLDVDNLLKYMAVHNFSVNEDSLSGMMPHNYYLYEHGGKLNIIPWDYNLSLGGMHGGNATAMINDPVDEPYSATRFFDALLQSEEYKEKYHEYYNKLIEEYIYGGAFEENFSRIVSLTEELVKEDPNAMYTAEQYVKGREMLKKTILLRAESVKGQLSGEIMSTAQGQKENSGNLVDGSEITISDMGTFMGGRR